jgi:hypothetical protein
MDGRLACGGTNLEGLVRADRLLEEAKEVLHG